MKGSVSPRFAVVAVAGVISLAALAAYWNSFSGAFVFDDAGSIADNPSIRHLWPIGPVLHPPFDGGRTVGGRPVVNLSLALNYAIGGTAVAGYHLTNLLIHVLAGLTLFGIIRRTFLRWSALPPTRSAAPSTDPCAADPPSPGSGGLRSALHPTLFAAAVALLWTVHPLQTEAVTYVVQRTESLMGLFYLLTLYCFIRSAEADEGTKYWRVPLPDAGNSGPRSGTRQRFVPSWAALSLLACLLGMATKEVMVSAPVIVFIYDRVFVSGTWSGAWRVRRTYYLGLAATWLVLGGLVISTHGRGGSSGFGLGVPWGDYVLTQSPALGRYLALSFWPHPLIFDYGMAGMRHARELWPWAAPVILLLGGALYSLSRPERAARVYGFAGVWFFAILAPTSLVPGGRMTMAEHRMYLALIPVIVGVVWGVDELLAWIGWKGRNLLFAATIAALAVCSVGATHRRNDDYRSDLILWSDTVAKRPDNPYAHNNLGGILFRVGESPAAIAQYEAALRIEPDYAEVHNNWGMVLAAEGQYAAAIAHYGAALRIKPDYPEADNNLGVALVDSGRPADAIACLKQALRLKADYPEAENDFGLALAATGRWPEAIEHYEQALRLQPDLAEADNNYGNALVHLGRLPEAIARYDQAVSLKPAYLEARRNLGLALVQAGRMPEAAECFERAVNIDPHDVAAREDLGNVLRTAGRQADAIAQYEEALRLKPDYPEGEFNLGNALADLGRNEEAAADYERALQLRPAYAEAALNLGLALAAAGKTDAAIAAYARALTIRPDYPEAHNNLGNALLSERRVDEAIAHYEEALRLDPNNGDAHDNLGQALRLAGRTDEARIQFELAKRLQGR